MNTTIGIDIGYETVKVIGLENHGKRWKLRGMNIAPIPANSWQTDAILNQDAIAQTVIETLKNAKPDAINGKRAMFALPESVIFSGTFAMPLLDKEELAQAIPFELADKLSINLEEFYFDYEVVTTKCKPLSPAELEKLSKASAKTKDSKKPEPTPIEQDAMTVFAVAAKKTLIESVVSLAKKAGLDPAGIDIKPGAIARAVIRQGDEKARAIIDLGAGSTGASIVEGQSIRVTSTVPWGVKALLDKGLGVEQLRKEFAAVFDELVHVTKFFENRVCPGTTIEEIILSGSGTNIPQIIDVFQQETGLPSKIGEPFGNVDTDHYPIKVQYSHTFSDAVGLAMRDNDA
ncbi:MAG: pilus assembly protein PilM [Candidatus Berkelbacteria bacterium]|nr:MAG: pilus assembly protein PilM [Candidatus Berkelbacteria bacterium]QQG51579.1 MAG: pilus assembly protein PilM [Candidatus Berkelbacteria bacterium]